MQTTIADFYVSEAHVEYQKFIYQRVIMSLHFQIVASLIGNVLTKICHRRLSKMAGQQASSVEIKMSSKLSRLKDINSLTEENKVRLLIFL